MSDPIALNDLKVRLLSAWDKHTSAAKEWNEDIPSRGQCAITALVVQDLFGGELLRTTVGGESHYLNRLLTGEIVDLTQQQFGYPLRPYDAEPVVRSRDYVLSFADTRRRYALLVGRLWR